MKKVLLLTLAALGGAANALDLGGTLPDAPSNLQVGIWAVNEVGEPVQLLGVAPLQGESWSLSLGSAPREASTLNPATLAWPGVLPPATLSQAVKAAEARAYAFADANGNGQPDAGEHLREVTLKSKGQHAFIVWTDGPVTVSAGKGYRAELQTGWNLLGIRLGKEVQVAPLGGKLELQLRP